MHKCKMGEPSEPILFRGSPRFRREITQSEPSEPSEPLLQLLSEKNKIFDSLESQKEAHRPHRPHSRRKTGEAMIFVSSLASPNGVILS
ncbi:hypothetical protein AAA799P11_00329 [Marine Group I thaumarchaeote SCGC AAA799-P11]|uniref:Uncharacterized protein n=1 Tax=Marine Group I thaumarchaeote SCGC AAA799-P11 TaxID=1502295 RepID=A0A087S2S0_9ARCH|nr:hypothetical protein AAA799P11_00329 [Marine Group I thaumarchaeote SCGC AAA799-P11]